MSKPNDVRVSRELRSALSMVLNALDRDAQEGKAARGEMAAVLRNLLAAPADNMDLTALPDMPLSEFLEANCAQPADQQGEPVAWIKPDVAETLTKNECCYAFGSQNPKGSLIPLYTHAQPATAKADERAEFESVIGTLDITRLPTGDYQNGYVQSTWEGWQARAKLNTPQ